MLHQAVGSGQLLRWLDRLPRSFCVTIRRLSERLGKELWREGKGQRSSLTVLRLVSQRKIDQIRFLRLLRGTTSSRYLKTATTIRAIAAKSFEHRAHCNIVVGMNGDSYRLQLSVRWRCGYRVFRYQPYFRLSEGIWNGSRASSGPCGCFVSQGFSSSSASSIQHQAVLQTKTRKCERS